MKRLYIAVATFFILCIFLFIAALVYLDNQKHKVYFYTINDYGHDIGTIKIDKYITDDRFIYKSVSNIPLAPLFTDSKARIFLDKHYGLLSFSKEVSGNGATDIMYLENRNNNVSFVAISQSEFACLDSIPIKKDTFIFEEESPVTYLPIIENYNFKLGRSQAFNTITDISTLLPPIRRLVTLTSIRDEYLKIGGRKIKTECLLLKIKHYPQGIVWVAKSDRSIIMIEFPSVRLKLTRSFSARALTIKDYTVEGEGYTSRNLTFTNGGIELACTFTSPVAGGKYPGVVLVNASGPCNRENQGIFTSLAGYLTKKGFCVLRFDKRGIGMSKGSFNATTDSDEIGDAKAALAFLMSQKEVDPDRIAIIGQDRGAFYASKIALGEKRAKALILLTPITTAIGIHFDTSFEQLKKKSVQSNWPERYLKQAMRMVMETRNKVERSKYGWVSILRNRCFLRRMREALDEKPLEILKNITIPVLILQGKEDDPDSVESAAAADKALEEGGNKNHNLIYFGYLGHFLGKKVSDGVVKMHYDTDPGVLEVIERWLANSLAQK